MGKKPPVPTNWDESAPTSRQGTPVSRAISPTTAHQPPMAPPGLPARKNAWESGAASYPTHPPGLVVPGKSAPVGPDRVGNFSAASWGSTGASTSSPDSDSGPATESDNPYNVHIHFSESMEEEFHGMGIKAIEDEDELRELDSIAPGVWDEPMGTATWETAPAAGWDDDAEDAEDHWKQNQEVAPKPILCNAHGIICKKGICAEYARQLRLTKRAEEEEKRKTASANRGKKGARAKGRGAGKKKNDENEDENKPSGKNTTQNNPFRGPGAPVKTNWRGAPRAIVSADTIEKRETAEAASDDGWGNSDPEVEPKAAAVVTAVSDVGWDVPKDAFDPWASTTAQPVTKAKPSGGKRQAQGKKPAQTKASSNWADQVDAELAGDNTDTFSTVSSKHSSKRGALKTGWGTSSAKSSASGWGSVANADMPW